MDLSAKQEITPADKIVDVLEGLAPAEQSQALSLAHDIICKRFEIMLKEIHARREEIEMMYDEFKGAPIKPQVNKY